MAEATATVNGHGGKRPGAGRKKGGSPTSAATGLAVARLRKEQALAELREIEVAEKRRELLSVEEVAESVETIIAIARSHLLAIPSRMAPDFVGQTDERTIESALRTDVHEALERMAADLRALVN